MLTIFTFIGCLLVILLLGKREPADLTLPEVSINKGVDHYLEKRENEVLGLQPGVCKEVIWAEKKGKKTKFCIIFLHGFSASKFELSPFPNAVALGLNANIYNARLSGHGCGGEALGRVTIKDWIFDLSEALEIGRRIGEKIIIIGSSTGGTLAAVGASEKNVSGIIFVSPNFKVRYRFFQIFTLGFARFWIPIILGKYREFKPISKEHAIYWTTRYPIVSIITMATLVKKVVSLNFDKKTSPALFFVSEEDKVVDVKKTLQIAEQWGGKSFINFVKCGPYDDPQSHVLAGDIKSPMQTEKLVQTSLAWIKSL
jgi:esterase/lipase